MTVHLWSVINQSKEMSRKKNIDDATVLEKALLVISDRGPESFTLTDIGKAVGLAPATLLQRFGSKQ